MAKKATPRKTKTGGPYKASGNRYESMRYNRCGRSGIMLPAISLGLWHNFGGVDSFDVAREILCRAFDLGITHFDLANNYGSSPRIGGRDVRANREKGPRPAQGRAHHFVKGRLPHVARSVRRVGLAQVSHCQSRPEPEADGTGVRRHILQPPAGSRYPARRDDGRARPDRPSGKALYAGISNYQPDTTRRAASILRELGTPCLIHQPSYNMFNRWIELDSWRPLKSTQMGCIVFSPLHQGLLTDRYLKGIPKDSRAGETPRISPSGDTSRRRG